MRGSLVIPSGMAGSGGAVGHDGATMQRSGETVLRVFPGGSCSGRSPAAEDRSVSRPEHSTPGTGAVLQLDGPALDRSGTADPHADRRLLLWHPLGTAAVRRG